MESRNPVLRRMLERAPAAFDGVMTVDGTVNKTFFMLLLVCLGAYSTYSMAVIGNQLWIPLGIGGVLVGFVLALVITFNPALAPALAPIYAGCEGLALGGVSGFAEQFYPGIATQAVLLTFGVAFAMLGLYRFKIIQVTDRFRTGLTSALMGLMVAYLISWVCGLLGLPINLIPQHGVIGLVVCGAIVVLAALSLTLDFDFIDQGAHQGAPRAYEWYGAFGLVVTLVWLYVEILRFLQILNSRD
jgi:uncharacterized YccA/Bax inhibitor family protein